MSNKRTMYQVPSPIAFGGDAVLVKKGKNKWVEGSVVAVSTAWDMSANDKPITRHIYTVAVFSASGNPNYLEVGDLSIKLAKSADDEKK